jgi:hypothetical protein
MATEIPTIDQNDCFPEGCFETPRSIQIEEKIFACVEFLCFVPIAILFGIAAGFIIWLLFNIVWPAYLFALFVGIFFLRIVWKGFLSRLCFYIKFHSDHLQIGRGLARCRFPYDLVEMISIQENKLKKAIYVEIECMNKELEVYLQPNSVADCVSMLLKSCNNAIYIDIYGNEYVSANATRPDFTMKNLRNHYIGRIMVCSLVAFFTLLWDLEFCVTMCSWINGKVVALDLYSLTMFVLLSGTGSASIVLLIRYVKKLSYLSRQMKKSQNCSVTIPD